MRLRLVAMILMATLALSDCTRALTSTGIVGRYGLGVAARDNPDWRGIVGDWELVFRADGRLIVNSTGGMHAEGLYRLDGDILTTNDLTAAGSASCRIDGVDEASARYRIHFTENGMRAEVLRDECPGRVSVMTNRLWQRIR